MTLKRPRRIARGPQPQSHLARLDRATVGQIAELTATTNHAAALTCARHAEDEDDLTNLLDALGLLRGSA